MFNLGLENAIEFLTQLFRSWIGYSTINTARSALSSVITLSGGTPVGEHPLICRFVKGVFELRPCLPKYTEIWDVAMMLNYLKTLDPPRGLTLKNLMLKAFTLLCLLSGQRSQTIHKFNIDFIQKLPTMYHISVREKLKHTRPEKHQKPFDFLVYPHNKRLCIMEYLTEYINRTAPLRGNHKNLLMSYVKPHQPVSKASSKVDKRSLAHVRNRHEKVHSP